MAKSKKKLSTDKSQKIRCIEFTAADPIFSDSYKEHYQSQPRIEKALNLFREYKRQIPPLNLPNGMKDHALSGRLEGIRECHLAGDSCLLYVAKGDTVTLLYVCDHDELYGPKERAIAKMLSKFF